MKNDELPRQQALHQAPKRAPLDTRHAVATAHREEGSLAGRGRRDDTVLLLRGRDDVPVYWMEVVMNILELAIGLLPE